MIVFAAMRWYPSGFRRDDIRAGQGEFRVRYLGFGFGLVDCKIFFDELMHLSSNAPGGLSEIMWRLCHYIGDFSPRVED